MFLFKNKNTKEIEEKLNELNMNLENNYKDLALKAFREFKEIVEDFKEQNKINEKEYKKYKEKIKAFEDSLKDYHH